MIQSKIIKVSNNEGGDLNWDLQQWATFRINADYDLSGKNVKAGDSTVVTVPDALMITNTSFKIRDINTNEIIANAEVSQIINPLQLPIRIMLKNMTTQKALSSSMLVSISKNTLNKEKFQLRLRLIKKQNLPGRLHLKVSEMEIHKFYQRLVGLMKVNKREVQYTISVNRTKQNIKGVTIEDHLQFTNASYVKDSIKV